MKADFILIAASIAWSFSLLAQECLVAHSQMNLFWVGSFVAVGESLFLLLSDRCHTKVPLIYNSFVYKIVILRVICEAFVMIGLLFVVEIIGSLRTLLAWYAVSIGIYNARYEKSKPVKFLITLSLALIFLSFILDGRNIVVGFFCCVLLGLLCLLQNVGGVFRNRRDFTSGAFWKIIASIIFAILAVFMTKERKLTVVSFFPWSVFPFLGIFAGFGKSFFLSSTELYFSSMSVIGALCVFLLQKVTHFTTTDVTTDSAILFSACVILFSTFKIQKQSCHLPSFVRSDFFELCKRRVSFFISCGTTSFSFYNREGKLVAFLLLNVCVMIIEFVYGISVNSLGLIADSVHMFIDSASLLVGFCAVCAASWPANEKTHPFGYARYEVLGGFVNGVLLLCVAFFVVIESVERMISPPEIQAAYLIHVSAIGLIVNVIGVFFFHEAHGHSHTHGGCATKVDHNMRGVYLHIIADLLGSISVMISSLIIYMTGVRVVDPVCTALSALVIAISAFPLLNETGKVLLLGNPTWNTTSFYEKLCNDLIMIEDVEGVIDIIAWTHSTAPRESIFCTVFLSAFLNLDKKNLRCIIKSYMRKLLASSLGTCHIEIYVHIEDRKSEVLEKSYH